MKFILDKELNRRKKNIIHALLIFNIHYKILKVILHSIKIIHTILYFAPLPNLPDYFCSRYYEEDMTDPGRTMSRGRSRRPSDDQRQEDRGRSSSHHAQGGYPPRRPGTSGAPYPPRPSSSAEAPPPIGGYPVMHTKFVFNFSFQMKICFTMYNFSTEFCTR